MRSILRVFPNRFFANLAIAGLIAGLVTSKVVLSVATITLLCNALINIHAGSNLKKWISDTTNLLFIALFIVYLLSGLYSTDTAFWVDRCRMKLPFIALPLGFTAVQLMDAKTLHRWLAFYVYVISIAAWVCGVNYFLHFETLNERLSRGQPIPAPLNDHIRFSLEMAFAIIAGMYIYSKGFYFYRKQEKGILLICIISLIILLHVFSVHSGIIAFYIGTCVVIAHFILSTKRYLIGALSLAGLALLLFFSTRYIPSLKNRIGYFAYEWELIQKGELNPEHSDAQRILSIQYGWEIGRAHPIGGVGIGDVQDVMYAKYAEKYGKVEGKSKLPHNQFIYVFAGTGIIGLCIFLFAVAWPIFHKKRGAYILFLVFNCMLIFSFLSEHTLEIQIGTAFYLVFLLLLKKHLDDKQAEAALYPLHA